MPKLYFTGLAVALRLPAWMSRRRSKDVHDNSAEFVAGLPWM